jgi:hypothetical protein
MSALAFPSIDQAIANFEKSNPAYNNPGSIMYGPFATAHGAVDAAPNGLAIFNDPNQGMAATDALVQHYAGMGFDINALINKWAPGSAPGNTPGSTSNYINAVAGAVGATPSTPVAATKSYPFYNPGGIFTNCHTDPNAAGCFGGATNAITDAITGNSKSNTPSAFSFGRIVSVILGLILIAGGIFLLKPSVQVGI